MGITDAQRRILEHIISHTYIANIPPFTLDKPWEPDDDMLEVFWEVDGAMLVAMIYSDGAVWWWYYPSHMQSSQEYHAAQEASQLNHFTIPEKAMATLWKMGNAYHGTMRRLSLEEHLESLNHRVA
jgi:hypothetical protein